MDRPLEGYERLRRNFWRFHGERFADLAPRGQSPSAMVVACCDSRVPPKVVFDCAPGEIFVVRGIANLVPPFAPDTANHGTRRLSRTGRRMADFASPGRCRSMEALRAACPMPLSGRGASGACWSGTTWPTGREEGSHVQP